MIIPNSKPAIAAVRPPRIIEKETRTKKKLTGFGNAKLVTPNPRMNLTEFDLAS